MARRILFAFVLAVVLFVLFVPIGSRRDMDISSGRVRSETVILGIRIPGGEEETEASRMYRELVGESGPPRWRTTSYTTSGVFGIRTHPEHHGSEYAAWALVQALEAPSVSREAKRKAISTIFDILQKDDGDYRAREYARAVEALVAGRDPSKGPISPEDLPAEPDF